MSRCYVSFTHYLEAMFNARSEIYIGTDCYGHRWAAAPADCPLGSLSGPFFKFKNFFLLIQLGKKKFIVILYFYYYFLINALVTRPRWRLIVSPPLSSCWTGTA